MRMSKGGPRPGSGRKRLDPQGKRRFPVTIMLTKDEETMVRDYVELIRRQKEEAKANESFD